MRLPDDKKQCYEVVKHNLQNPDPETSNVVGTVRKLGRAQRAVDVLNSRLFGLTATDGSGMALRQAETSNGGLVAVFLEDQVKINQWLTLNGGVRLSHFQGSISENAADPRVGAAVRVPHLNWVLRGFYGRFYQAPPLSTVSGPLLAYALDQGFSFLPLRGERNEENQVGIAIPFRGWTLYADHFHSKSRNFFDHDALGNSNIFLPLTLQGARIDGWEITLRSPMLLRRGQMHVAYSSQRAEGWGERTGGLTFFAPPSDLFLLDHDQQNTLSVGPDCAGVDPRSKGGRSRMDASRPG